MSLLFFASQLSFILSPVLVRKTIADHKTAAPRANKRRTEMTSKNY
jgi:hypothetical protein